MRTPVIPHLNYFTQPLTHNVVLLTYTKLRPRKRSWTLRGLVPEEQFYTKFIYISSMIIIISETIQWPMNSYSQKVSLGPRKMTLRERKRDIVSNVLDAIDV